MSSSIPCSIKNLTLKLFLFILVGILYLSLNLLWCQLCTFYCPLRKKRYTFVAEGTDVHMEQHIHQKELNLCLPLYYNAKVLVELGKTQARNLNVL